MTKDITSGRGRRSLRPAKLAARTLASRAALAASNIAASSEDRQRRLAEFHASNAARYVEALGQMKGVMMKVGQLAAFIDLNVIPVDFRELYRSALGNLLDNAPSMGIDVVRGVVENDLGAPPSELFETFSDEPIAAASIGQVHAARLRDGTEVAVKVQYPGAAEAIESDLRNTEMLTTFFRMGQSLMRGLAPRVDLEEMVEEFRDRVTEELDYVTEAENQRLFGDLYRDHPFIRIPAVVGELSGRRVLTMELASGMRWGEALEAPDPLRQRWAEVVWRFVFGSFYRFHVFNADPHPGNYLFHDDGTVTFLDFGCVKRFTDEFVSDAKEIVQKAIRGDAVGLRELLVRIDVLTPDDDLDPAQILEWHRYWYLANTEPRFTFTSDYVADLIGKTYNPLGEWGLIARRFKGPKDSLFLNRINVGLWSILASLRATNEWAAIHGQIWGESPPAGLFGEQEAQWLVASVENP